MPQTNPSRDTIFCEAIAIDDADARAAYVAGACGVDAELRSRVEALVDAHFRAGNFLDQPADPLGATSKHTPFPEEPGTMVGPYKLLERLGEGGMGEVYVAEQTEPVRRRVALKIVKLGMDSKEVVARFEAERQALALMDHPNIAHVFDGGTTAAGRPFFVMELVRGLPITEYCDQAKLSAERRLKLFMQVCRAVQHAHQKGIIHRDIKPSNVMVTLHDGEPVPKVIDFGVAKAIGQPLTEKSLYTQHTQLLGTPMYMSPEQAELSGLDIDTRSDVYSLGVLLYELLTGATPFDSEVLKSVGFDEMRRMIREDDPPRPSQRLSTIEAATRSTIFAQRGLDERHLSRLLSGDLDWIVMKALEKDRNRRYESAGALVADIERYLAHTPVEARPPSATYRLRKFVRRNRNMVVGGSIVGVVLLLGLAGTIAGLVWAINAEKSASLAAQSEAGQREEAEKQKDEAIAARTRADEEAAAAKAVNDFMRDMLEGATPEMNPRGRKVTVEELLDRSAVGIGSKFAKQPKVEAAIRLAIGQAYLSMGNYKAAEPHLEAAANIRQREYGPKHSASLEAVVFLAYLSHEQGQFDRALTMLTDAVQTCRQTLEKDHDVTQHAINRLAMVHYDRGHLAEAELLHREELDISIRKSGKTNINTLSARQNLATVLFDKGRLDEAEAQWKQVLEAGHQVHGTDSVPAFVATHGLGLIAHKRDDHDRAESLFREALEQGQKAVGKDHPSNVQLMLHLAEAYRKSRKFEPAEKLLVEAIALGDRIYPSNHPSVIAPVELLSLVYLDQDKFALAAPMIGRLLELRRRIEPKLRSRTFGLMETFNTLAQRHNLENCLNEMNNLAVRYIDEGKPELAVPLLEEVNKLERLHFPKNLRENFSTMRHLGNAHLARGDQSAAFRILEEEVALQKATFGADHSDARAALVNLGVVYWTAKRLDKSIPLFEQLLARDVSKHGPNHAKTIATRANLGVNYKDAGRLAEAIPMLEAAYQASKKRVELRFVEPVLLDAYVKTSRTQKAMTLVQEVISEVRSKHPPASSQLAGNLAPVGLTLLKVNLFAEAEPILRECLDIRERVEPNSWTTFNTQSMLGGALLGQNKYAGAEPLLIKGYTEMKQRQAAIPAAGKERLNEALQRLVQLYEATDRPDEAAKWRLAGELPTTDPAKPPVNQP